MFTHLRQTAQGFFAKVILFLLVGMFALWGVGDVFRNMGGGAGNVATVGKVPITVQEFHAMLERRGGQPQQIIAGLINDLLVEQEEKAMGIVVSDDQVVDFISSLPEFHGKDGQFDKAIYQKMLESGRTNEAMFVSDIRHEIGAKLLLDAYTGWIQVPEAMVDALYKSQEEQRSADILPITSSAIAGRAAVPADQDIKAYYDAHSKDYLASEYRTLTYVALPVADVQAKINVSPDEISRAYAEHKDDYRQSERRQVDDLQFDNEQEAKEALAKLSKEGFAKSAASLSVSNADKTALGAITSQDMPPEAAQKVFGLPQDGLTPIIFADVAWHIYHVSKIEAARMDTLEEARPLIVSEIASRGAQEVAVKLINGFEDALAGGATLDKAAEKIGQKPHSIGPVTKEGMMPDGSKAEIPTYNNFLTVAFTVAQGDHSQAVQTADGSYFMVRVDSVTPSHVKVLAEVREQVVKQLLDERTTSLLEKTAQAVSEQLRAGKKLPDVLKANGVTSSPVSSGNFKRATEIVQEGPLRGKQLSRGLISEIFRSKPGQTTHAYPEGDGSYMIATLTQIIPAPAKPDPKIIDQIRGNLKTTLADEILHQYLNYLRGKYPVSFNPGALGIKNGAVRNESDGE